METLRYRLKRCDDAKPTRPSSQLPRSSVRPRADRALVQTQTTSACMQPQRMPRPAFPLCIPDHTPALQS